MKKKRTEELKAIEVS